MNFLNDATLDQIKAESAESLENEVGKTIYKAALIFERLEAAGVIVGNGHHIAQKLSTAAEKLFRERLRQ